jgi:uncharacterized membrane protein YjjP (DUF1212 family)
MQESEPDDHTPAGAAAQYAAAVSESPVPERRATLFILRLGHALHASGFDAQSLEDVLRHVSERLGVIAQFFTTPTVLFAAFGALERQHTHLIRIRPAELNLGNLARLDAVAHQVVAGTLSPDEGSAEIDTILRARETWRWWIRVLGYGIASAAGCRFLGGGLLDIQVSLLVGLLVGSLALALKRFTISSNVFEITASALASGLATWLALEGLRISVPTTTLAGLVGLLPGLTVTMAMTELSSRHLVSGTARMSIAFIVFAAMAFGVALGTALVTAVHGGTFAAVAPEPLPEWTLYAALAVAPLAFSLLLRARPRDIPLVFGASYLGYASFQAGALTLNPLFGAAVGALAVGAASNLFERAGFGPASVPLVPGVLLLVPGSIGYRSLTLLMTADIETGISAGVQMILTAVALAVGMLAANVLVPRGKVSSGVPAFPA